MVVLLHAEDHHSPGKFPVSLPSVTRLSDQWPDPWLCVPASRRVCPCRERVSARFELQTSRAARWMPACGPHAEGTLSVSGTNSCPETSGFHPKVRMRPLRGPPITKSGSGLSNLSSRRTRGARRLSGVSAWLRGRDALQHIFTFC